MTEPKVSIVVLNWNGKRFIDDFMSSFLAQTYPKNKLELLFVDNKSSDDSVGYFNKKYSDDDRCKPVLNDKNYGYAGGNNLGTKQAAGDYILICNNDLILDKNTVSELVKTGLKNNADVTCSKLMYLNKPGIINNAGSTLKPNSDWPIIEIGINEKDGDKYSKDYEISAFCGACVLVKRSFFKDVGLFDSKFFLYFEDGDLSWRGQKAKKKYYFSAKALAYHHHSGSTTEHSDLFNFFVARNRILILTKNASYKVIFKVWIKTIRDHFLFRTKRLYLALMGRYSKKLALKESYNGFKIIFAALIYTPYALCKRYNIIKEEYL